MLRYSSLVALTVGSSLLLSKNRSSCTAQSSHVFDPRGMPINTVPSFPNAIKNPLILAAVGMRRKNFYIVEVDVYLVGISISPSLVKKAQQCAAISVDESSVVDCLMVRDSKATNSKATRVAATLRMVRGVTTSQIVDAFNESFAGCNQEAIDQFKAGLAACVGTNGIKAGEEVVFYWQENGELIITMNGAVGGTIVSDEICKRLLDIYIDPTRSVAPEVAKCFHSNIRNITL